MEIIYIVKQKVPVIQVQKVLVDIQQVIELIVMEIIYTVKQKVLVILVQKVLVDILKVTE